MPLSNIWGTTLGILDRTGSLNKAQSVTNEDGTYTYVVSGADPGVHNWIDTGGLPEGILTLRMAEFPEGGARPDLSAQRTRRQARPARRGGARPGHGQRRPSGPTSSPNAVPGYVRRLPEVAGSSQ